MTRLAAIALVLLAVGVSVGFGGRTPASATGACRIQHTGTGIDYGFGVQGLDTELADGSFVLGSYYEKSYRLRLVHILPDCQIVSTFGIHNKQAGIDVIAGTPDGRILLGGSAGNRAIVGRILADGTPDRSFGVGGWRRFRPGPAGCEKFFGCLRYGVTSIAFGPSGTIVLGGGGEAIPHGVLRFASELTPNGRWIRTFGGDGSVNPDSHGSYTTTQVFANPDGTVYAFGQSWMFASCVGPSIVRINADGSSDSRFDKAVRRTITHIAPSWKQCFMPTVVPDGTGGFTLVGGLDRPYARPQPRSGGVSVRIGASGQMVGGLTHFRSPGFAFDEPATIRLPSGRVVVAGVRYTADARAKEVLVQVFGPDGRRDLAIGDHGLLRYPVPLGRHTHWMTADLLPAPSGGVWLLTGLKHEYDLTLLPVS